MYITILNTADEPTKESMIDCNDNDKNEPLPNVNIKLLNQYIRALSVNVNRKKLPSAINLIFDSGAVNGIIAIGAALYIHNLEKLDYFKIKKISGCSIGSVIALWYAYDCPEEMYTYIDTLFAYYKKHKDFYIYEKIVTEMVHTLVKNEDMSIINDKLHINYYDTKKCKQKIVSHFKNSEHLIKCILRSSHVPFLTNENYKYEGRYIDGISPYIFTDDTKNLFIKLIHFTNPLQCMNVKTDQNIYARLLRGVIAVNDFFMDGTTTICSYVDNKSYMIRLQLLARKYFILYIMLLIELLITIKNNVPLDVTNTILYTKGVSLFKYCWGLLQNKLV